MALRFPDFQVLFPRSTQMPNTVPESGQQYALSAHAHALTEKQERARREQTVGRAQRSEGSSLGARQGRAPKRGGSGSDGSDLTLEADRGRYLDVKV